MALLNDLAVHLAAQGVGTVSADIFFGSKAKIPDGAGPYLTLTETGGTAATRVQNKASANTLRPTVQVAVRARTYAQARAMAQAAYYKLDGVFNATLSGTFYQRIVARQEPTDIGLDGDSRPVIVFNLEIEKQPDDVSPPAFDQAFQ